MLLKDNVCIIVVMSAMLGRNNDDCFWGGSAIDGKKNSINAGSDFCADYRLEYHNQVMPLFMSNKGRYIWSDNSFGIEVKDGIITIDGEDVKIYEAGKTLKDARTAAMNKHFPCDKRELPMEYFTAPQFNTWMEFIYHPTQASVLCPMVQFSWVPWRALSEKSLNIVKKAVELRQKLTPYIMELVEKFFTTCEPIVRNLEYNFPHQGLENCMDCFMLGDKYLVAPVTIQGDVTKTLTLPEGKWKYLDGIVYESGIVTVDAPIQILPYFERI